MARLKLKERIRRHCNDTDGGISVAEFARRAGIPPKRLHGFISGSETSIPLARKLKDMGFPACPACGRAECWCRTKRPPVDVEAVRSALAAGGSVADVALKMNVSQPTVYRIDRGIYTADERRAFAAKRGMALNERNREIKRRREAGETLQAISDRFGLTKERIRQICASGVDA